MLVLQHLKNSVSMPEPTAQFNAILALAASLQQSALATRQRRVLMLSGPGEWSIRLADNIASLFSAEQSLWVSRQSLEGKRKLTNSEVFKHLGGEADLVVYDAHRGFDADAFGAVTGLIRGGGLLLLLTPPLSAWPGLRDPEAERFFPDDSSQSLFLQRFISVAQRAEGVALVTQEDVPAPIPSAPQAAPQDASTGPYRSEDQAQAVAAIIKVAHGHRRRPVVLVSDRGRGKSSALGIAAAQLLRQGARRIIVTGPRLDAVAAVFQHAHRLLPGNRQARGLLETDEGRLEYMAPDELIATRPETDLLLVDEAAAIPAPMLNMLLAQHARIAFATTVHGYEGTGRGFALRFNKVLDRKTPGWQQLRLQQPIRWAEGDPLEQFVFDALLLNASIAAETEINMIMADDCRAERLPRDRLIQDETLLSQVFGLLVLAHYRTRPNDLRQLLDSPGLQIHVLRHRRHIVAVALLIKEGGLDEKLGTQVYLGRRRLPGHLLPQSLAFHAGMVEAPSLRYLRLMRIAVHPVLQGRGLGSRLVGAISDNADARVYDCVGTSFGVTAELLRFWRRLDFVPARLGLTREHSSGCHSLIMLRPVSDKGRRFVGQVQQQMQAQLPDLLSDPLRDFDAELARLLLQGCVPDKADLSLHDWREIIGFAHGKRGYEFCMTALGKVLIPALADDKFMRELNSQQRRLLVAKVIQRQAWAAVIETCGVSGRKAALNLLRDTVRQLVARNCPQTTRETIERSLDL